MFGRQRISITREGVYYALVVLFILGGAALRQVNLLVIFAGLLVAPAILHWRIVALSLRRLGMKRKFRETAYAGRPLTVSVELSNQRNFLGVWGVSVEDTVISSLDAHVGRSYVMVPYVPPSGMASAEYQITLPRRGLYTLGPMVASTQFPLGLFRSWLRYYHSDKVLALPRLGDLKKGWSQLFQTRAVARQALGSHRQGSEGDFFALREWRTGDSRRWIHWRSSARMNFPVVRQMEQPQRREVGVIVDLWTPSQPTEEDQGWLEMAVSFAASAAHSLISEEGRRVHVIVCAKETKRWSGDISNLAIDAIMRALAVIEPGETTDVASRVVELSDSLRTDSPLIVLSTRGMDNFHLSPAIARRAKWIDVRSEERKSYFVLPSGDETQRNQQPTSEATEAPSRPSPTAENADATQQVLVSQAADASQNGESQG